MKITKSTVCPDINDIVLDTTDTVDLEESYKFFITKSIEFLGSNADVHKALSFLCLIWQAVNHNNYRPKSSVYSLKNEFDDFDVLFKNLTHIGRPNAANHQNTKGSVVYTTFLAAYVCYTNLLEKYLHLFEDNSIAEQYYKYLYNANTSYAYNTIYNYQNGTQSIVFATDKESTEFWRVKNAKNKFVSGLTDIFNSFEHEVYSKAVRDTNHSTSCVYGNLRASDILKKAFNVGMFTYNIGKLGESALYNNNSGSNVGKFTEFLVNDLDLLKFYLEKVFLYPSPSITSKYKELFMLKNSYGAGLFSENKIDSAEFCKYMKTRGHPVNTKTARLIASFAGVFDDPLNFDFYLTKFLYTTREESRGKQLVDEIKRAIDICEEKNKELEEAKQLVVNQQISVFEHLVKLARSIRKRNSIERYLFMMNRGDLINEQFSRGKNVGIVEEV